MDGSPAASRAALALRAARGALFETARAGNLEGFPARLSAAADRYFTARPAELGVACKRPFALLAVGGYGRSELCPHSDIDLLVLFAGRIPREAEALTRALCFPLWDLGLDLGHGVRSIGDCLALSRSDPQVLASLLDARFLAGDPGPWTEFQKAFGRKIGPRQARAFADWLQGQNALRESQFGDGSGLLEPDLKNGLGGLRGIHHMRWLERIFALAGQRLEVFNAEERVELEEAHDFLLRTRTALHLAAGRHADTLIFEHQPQVAEALGFSGPRPGLAVEAFLSALHRAMTRVKSMRRAMGRACCPERPEPCRNVAPGLHTGPAGLEFQDPSALARNPALALDLFLAAARSGRDVSWQALRAVRAALPGLGRALAGRPETLAWMVELFLADTRSGQQASQVLAETGLLAAILPEFGQAADLVQFDDYHLHPLGRHTLECVRILARFLALGSDGTDGRNAPGGCRWCLEAAARMDSPATLLLAGLCHDLAKPLPGDHSEQGAALARSLLQRYGQPAEVVEDVAFLVQRHLYLPITATRRDLSQEGVLSGAAGIIGTARRLDLLALLSVADSLATGPRAWNNWTAALFAEFYFKTRKLLTEGPLSEPDATRRIVETRDRVRGLCTGRFDGTFMERSLDAMPARALQILDPESVVRHLALAARLEEALEEDRRRKPAGKGGVGVCLVEARPSTVEGCWELTVAALDRPGLFATLAGVLSLHGFNVFSAELFTWTNGAALDLFVVSEPPDSLFPGEAWARVQRSAHYALTGKLELEARLAERRNSPLAKASRPRYRPAVHVDNAESDFYTRIEVKAGDRLGLLHDIARALHRLGLDIQLARIATSGGRIADVFYVRDAQGNGKVEDPERLRAVEQALLEAGEP
jgi:[protein-PII] uridylyltransferase